TSTRPQWISDKKINILLQMGLKTRPDLKGVPTGDRVREVRNVASVPSPARHRSTKARDAAPRFRRDHERFRIPRRGRKARDGGRSGYRRERASASPDISHYLCMIEQVCATICSVFCRRTALWRRMTRDSLGLFRGCGCSDDEVSVGL